MARRSTLTTVVLLVILAVSQTDQVKDWLQSGGDTPIVSVPNSSKQSTSFPKAQVLKIKDGDSLEVRFQGKEQRVRLHQIDAPEYKQTYGKQAKRALERLIGNTTVALEVNDVDQYGRLVAILHKDSVNVNRTMVAQGHAWAYRQFVEDQQYVDAENAARAAKLGLWSNANATPPWEWRRANRN